MLPAVQQASPPKEYDANSAMAALLPQQQLFIECLIEVGASPTYVEQAAARAGYNAKYGWTLMRMPRVLAALREEASKHLLSGALLGAKVLQEIALDSQHKDRFRAAKELLAHSGFTAVTEQKITIDAVGSEARELIREIKEFAIATGLDAKTLLGSIGVRDVVVDAEFVEVEPRRGDTRLAAEQVAETKPATEEASDDVWGV